MLNGLKRHDGIDRAFGQREFLRVPLAYVNPVLLAGMSAGICGNIYPHDIGGYAG